MADLNDPVPGTGVSYYSALAAFVGSMLTVRFLREASPWGCAVSVISSNALAFFTGPAIAEWLALSANKERAMMLTLAFLGGNVLAGAWTFADKWRQDPQAAITWLLTVIPFPKRG